MSIDRSWRASGVCQRVGDEDPRLVQILASDRETFHPVRTETNYRVGFSRGPADTGIADVSELYIQ